MNYSTLYNHASCKFDKKGVLYNHRRREAFGGKVKRKNTRAPCRIRREGITCRGVVPFACRRRRDVLFFSFFLRKNETGQWPSRFFVFMGEKSGLPGNGLYRGILPLHLSVGAGIARTRPFPEKFRFFSQNPWNPLYIFLYILHKMRYN